MPKEWFEALAEIASRTHGWAADALSSSFSRQSYFAFTRDFQWKLVHGDDGLPGDLGGRLLKWIHADGTRDTNRSQIAKDLTVLVDMKEEDAISFVQSTVPDWRRSWGDRETIRQFLARAAPGTQVTGGYQSTRDAPTKEDFTLYRRRLGDHRWELQDLGIKYSRAHLREGEDIKVKLLVRPDWIASPPIRLQHRDDQSSVTLRRPDDTSSYPREATLREPFAKARRLFPPGSSEKPHETYCQTIQQVINLPTDRFTNGRSYRLTGVARREGRFELDFGICGYFDFQNHGEVLSLEMSFNAKWDRGATLPRFVERQEPPQVLPLRDAIDPFDLSARYVIPGIDTLTLIRAQDERDRQEPEKARFMFMQRSGTGGVAASMGVWHTVPAGEFQPLPDLPPPPADRDPDFDLWHNVVRESLEEMRLIDERKGEPVDYHTPRSDSPYVREYERKCALMCEALREEKVSLWFLGLGLDPLTLKGEIMLACVWDHETFYKLFPEMLDDLIGHNRYLTDTDGTTRRPREGDIFRPDFTEAVVANYVNHVSSLAAGATCLQLAWDNKALLFAESLEPDAPHAV